MSTEAEKSRRVISELRARDGFALGCDASNLQLVVQMRRRIPSSFLAHLCRTLPRLASFVTAAEEGARIFIAAENRSDCAVIPFSLLRRPPSAR